MPGPESLLWWPARAALGEAGLLVLCLVLSVFVFAAVVAFYAPRFGGFVVAAASVRRAGCRDSRATALSSLRSPPQSLRHKERVLLLRDPWLISQSLMQLLYLLPPALLLWHNYGRGDAAIILVPVLVMAAGQLAGGLAWLTISGEDAPDLVGSAPVSSARLLRAKVEAVMQCIAIIFFPFVAALVLISPLRP